MEARQEDVTEFTRWLRAERGVGIIVPADIETTDAPLWAFEDDRCERASRSQKGNRVFSVWWRDLYVCDFSDYRLVYRVKHA